MKPDLPNLEQMKDILDLKGVQVWDWSVPIAVIAGLLLLLLLFLIYLKFFRGRKSTEETGPPPTPLEEALSRLNRLVDSGMVEAGKIRSFYFNLSEIFRDFMEKETGIQANEATQEELRPLLKSTEELTGEELSDAFWFIELCDLAKFAKYTPTKEEWVRSVKVCRLLITSVATRREVKRRAGQTQPEVAMG